MVMIALNKRNSKNVISVQERTKLSEFKVFYDNFTLDASLMRCYSQN